MDALLFIGHYAPYVLPFILQQHWIILVVDYWLINPLLKVLLYHIGWQASRPICSMTQGFKCFGMPSGHSENLWLFTSLTNYNPWAIALTCIVMWQRWYEGYHTIGQIIVGAIIGNLIGYAYKLKYNYST